MRIIQIWVLAILSLYLSSSGFTQQKLIKSEDFYKLKTISDCQISPDGKLIAYVIKKVDKNHNRYTSNIWLYSLENNSNKQITTTQFLDTTPRWSPDSKYIVYQYTDMSDTLDKNGLRKCYTPI